MDSKILYRSTISNEIKEILLQNDFFNFNILKVGSVNGNYIEKESKCLQDSAILEFLKQEEINHENFIIEYWFQYQTEGRGLTPHCDYNYLIQQKLPETNMRSFLEKVNERYYLSPITIAAYLEINNLDGGELCISNLGWKDTNDMNIIFNSDYEIYKPIEGEVLYFKGSSYYHWINTVKSGSRKSLLINFWPKDIKGYSHTL